MLQNRKYVFGHTFWQFTGLFVFLHVEKSILTKNILMLVNSLLLVWIEEIGEKIGAKNYLFRNESITADVQALPPPAKQMEVREIPVKNLRLYCLVLNEHVVFLFNGGIKTTNNAKDCPNVGPHIKRANQIAGKIDEQLKQNEITWNFDHTDIKFDKNLEFEL